MPTIPELLDLHKAGIPPADGPEVAAVIGSGGKTALVWLLAESFRARKVLVSTTVKMRPPLPGRADVIITRPDMMDMSPRPGVTFAAIPAENDKMASPPPPLLAKLFPRFDICLLECDGAGERPYKGWAEYEPVVPDAATLTIAVIPVPGPGWKVDERWVHRLPLFRGITGARPGDALRPELLANAITHPGGLLGKAKGRTVLFLNQTESLSGEQFARETVSLLPESCRDRLALIISGSARHNHGVLLP